MKRNFRMTEPIQTAQTYRGPYQEIAIYVRDLLKCDYALVARPEKDSIRIHGFAGRESERYGDLAAHLVAGLRDWTPVVVDQARLIAAPVSRGGHILGVLVGYSSNPGTFTADDLERLMAYSHVAANILADFAAEPRSQTRATFTNDELHHLSRLITIGELSSCFAHEVANPLTLIRGHLRFIDDALPPDHPLRSNLDVIDRASRRIEDMARRMLDFSKKKAPRTGRWDLAELISEALRFIQPYSRRTFMDVQVQIEREVPAVPADRAQMVQVFVNLIQNAADAMAEVDHRVLSITAASEAKQVRIVISDTGTGIAPENLSTIFEPFFTTKGARGTGLGLYITKQIIEEHRGSIDVQSGDRGTSFVISLPL